MKDEKRVWETVLFSFSEDQILRELTAESSYVAKSLVGTAELQPGWSRSIIVSEEERPFEALCYQYEQQMLSQMREGAGFGELVAFESADAARSAFESFLQEQAARKRGRFSTKLQELNDNATIKKIMAAYDRTHGEYDFEGMHVLWSTVDLGAALEYDSSASRRDGGAKA